MIYASVIFRFLLWTIMNFSSTLVLITHRNAFGEAKQCYQFSKWRRPSMGWNVLLSKRHWDCAFKEKFHFYWHFERNHEINRWIDCEKVIVSVVDWLIFFIRDKYASPHDIKLIPNFLLLVNVRWFLCFRNVFIFTVSHFN